MLSILIFNPFCWALHSLLWLFIDLDSICLRLYLLISVFILSTNSIYLTIFFSFYPWNAIFFSSSRTWTLSLISSIYTLLKPIDIFSKRFSFFSPYSPTNPLSVIWWHHFTLKLCTFPSCLIPLSVICRHQDKSNVWTFPNALTSLIPEQPLKFNVWTFPSALTSLTQEQQFKYNVWTFPSALTSLIPEQLINFNVWTLSSSFKFGMFLLSATFIDNVPEMIEILARYIENRQFL